MKDTAWHDALVRRGFSIMESTTRTYKYGNVPHSFTGSLVYENSKGAIVDEPGKDTGEIFCPFLHADDDSKPNRNFQTMRLRNLMELDEYLFSPTR